MSQAHPGMSPREWFQYMEALAASNEDIGHVTGTHVAFARKRLSTVEDVATEFKHLQDTALIVDMYEEEGMDNLSDNKQSRKFGAFTVAMRSNPNKDSHDTEVDKLNDCRRIALQILARMKKDQTNQQSSTTKRFAYVDLNSWRGDDATAFLTGAWVAWRIEVPFTNVERDLVYDPGKWDDDNSDPWLLDLTGLSCENLNHPTLGLTAAQRMNCLRVTIYENNGTTVNTYVAAGGSYTLPASTDMPYIKAIYADLAEAAADTSTVPDADQAIKITDTGRVYPGDGTSNASELIAGALFYLPVTETDKGINAVVQTENVGIQLTQPS